MNNLTATLHASRPGFLVLAPLCVLLGIFAAAGQGVTLERLHVLLVIAGGLLAHAAVNWLNEYDDYRSGLDLATVRTPFSGGSGSLPMWPAASNWVLMAGVLSLLGVLLIGAYFLWLRGIELLLPGLLGLALVMCYTRWLTRSPVLCLLAPGLGFGPVMIASTVLALGGRIDIAVASAALIAGLLISELLLLNQFPDVAADARHGRRHLPILLGRERAARWVVALLLGSYAVLGLAVLLGWLPSVAGLALLALPLAVWLSAGIVGACDSPARLAFWIGVNVVTLLATLGLLNLGLALHAGAA